MTLTALCQVLERLPRSVFLLAFCRHPLGNRCVSLMGMRNCAATVEVSVAVFTKLTKGLAFEPVSLLGN